jgi:hypothetical protein
MVALSEIRSYLSTLTSLGPNLVGVFGNSSLELNQTIIWDAS